MERIAVVTGASRGIGMQIAIALAKEGCSLGICSKNSGEQLHLLARQLENEYGVRVLCRVGDVGDFHFVEGFLQDVEKELGTVDILVNNAGISKIGLLTDLSPQEWQELMDVNINSCFYCCRQVIPGMVRKQSGRIINISSVWGTVGASCEVAYSATKGAMNSFTKALAKELAPSHISVNAIACGVIDTQMNQCFDEAEREALMEEIPAGRFGSAKEVADFVLRLVDSSDYLTGQIITFDGGWT